jgi:hypothetical protein
MDQAVVGRGMRTGVVIVLLTAACAVLPGSAQADACSATDGASLTSALADPDCALITLAAGTYTSPSGFTAPVRSVTIAGPGPTSATITRSGAGNAFSVPSGANLTLGGVTLSGATSGAGLSVTGTGVASLSNSVVGPNANPANGAGIAFSGATLNVSNTAIQGNTTAADGGGFANSGVGTATFNQVIFRDNGAVGSGGAADTSGGVAATTNFKNVTFTSNIANGDAGAVRSGTATDTINLNNVTIAGNTADVDDSGGGDGGGISNSGGMIKIGNSIVANNGATGGGAPDCDSALASPLTRAGYELIRSATGCTFGGTGDTATGYQTGVDPLLGALDDNGAALPTMALLPGSPAVNAGNPAAPSGTGGTCEATDQRGRPRSGAVLPCDLGAFEVQRAICHNIVNTIGMGQATPVALSCSGDPFVYSITGPPSNGTLTGFDPITGAVTYTPNPGFTGTDQFTYAAVNGPLSSGPWFVTFTVQGPVQPTPNQPSVPGPHFSLKKALKRCKKVPKGPKRKKCIKKAKKRAKNL